MNLLLTDTVARPNREWLERVFAVAVIAGSRQPSLRNERVGVFEVGRVMIGGKMRDGNSSLEQ